MTIPSSHRISATPRHGPSGARYCELSGVFRLRTPGFSLFFRCLLIPQLVTFRTQCKTRSCILTAFRRRDQAASLTHLYDMWDRSTFNPSVWPMHEIGPNAHALFTYFTLTMGRGRLLYAEPNLLFVFYSRTHVHGGVCPHEVHSLLVSKTL